MGQKSETYRQIKQLLKTYSGRPEPNRTKLGYSLDDCCVLLSSVERHDLPFRSQTWAWVSRISGVPETTCRRILKDSYESEFAKDTHEAQFSLLAMAATQYGYVYYTKAKKYYSHLQKRSVIVSVCRTPVKEE